MVVGFRVPGQDGLRTKQQTRAHTQDGDKCGFILERIYQGSGDGTYSLTRIYEGHITIKNKSILGEGKIEMEKYSDLITVGFFSIVSIDDERDDIDKLGGGHAVLEGVDQ